MKTKSSWYPDFGFVEVPDRRAQRAAQRAAALSANNTVSKPRKLSTPTEMKIFRACLEEAGGDIDVAIEACDMILSLGIAEKMETATNTNLDDLDDDDFDDDDDDLDDDFDDDDLDDDDDYDFDDDDFDTAAKQQTDLMQKTLSILDQALQQMRLDNGKT